MKLIFCPECTDIVKMFSVKRKCKCGASWGNYINDIDIVIGGKAIPMGISNEAFETTYRDWNEQSNAKKIDIWFFNIFPAHIYNEHDYHA